MSKGYALQRLHKIVRHPGQHTVRGDGRLVSHRRQHIRGLATVAAIWGLLCSPTAVPAAETNTKPLWEIGIAGGGGWVPDYPASEENHLVGLALPYAVYRGEIFRAGDKGIVRGRFLRSDRHEFDISLSGSFPTDSDDNDARRGMPDLDTLIEVGPRLQLTLADISARGKFGLELPVRTVFSIALDDAAYRGVVFHPKLVYRHGNVFQTGIGIKLSAGPIVATEELMDYFYEVDDRFVTPTRPAFDADAGYLGSEVGLLTRKKITKRVNIFAALRVGYYKGATNEDSPLFKSDVNVSFGLGFSWSIFQSKKRVAE